MSFIEQVRALAAGHLRRRRVRPHPAARGHRPAAARDAQHPRIAAPAAARRRADPGGHPAGLTRDRRHDHAHGAGRSTRGRFICRSATPIVRRRDLWRAAAPTLGARRARAHRGARADRHRAEARSERRTTRSPHMRRRSSARRATSTGHCRRRTSRRTIRAYDPKPGAFTTLGGTDVKLFGARAATRDEDKPDGDAVRGQCSRSMTRARSSRAASAWFASRMPSRPGSAA